jgi:hypothetical protein
MGVGLMPKVVILNHPFPEREIEDFLIEDGNINKGTISWIKEGPKYNKVEHARKYLVTKGNYINKDEELVEDVELGFWGEWEASSKFTRNSNDEVFEPKYFHYPVKLDKKENNYCINTDPCVFGNNFIYSNCKQNRKGAVDGKIKNLESGDIVIFGGFKKKNNKLVLLIDTVLVVKHMAQDFKNHSTVSKKFTDINIYRNDSDVKVEIPSWYNNLTSSTLSKDFSYTLYLGANYEDKFNDKLYSFFPCKPYEGNDDTGFNRIESIPVELDHPIFVDNGIHLKLDMKRAFNYKVITSGNNEFTEEQMHKIWDDIRKYIFDQGLQLGVYAQLP